jgi:hypothetical protein
MTTQRKLQVFVSSTYTDLRDERQAAVAAILAAGHVPAGMELFAAGDETQMTVIRRWIDESDVFMLILGWRHGSIEPETGKSYVQLEYEHALANRKPLFAVVRSEDPSEVPSAADAATEQFQAFRALVLTHMVRFWSESNEIKLSIFESLAEFSRRPELSGWVRAESSVNVGAISEEIARLSRENAELRERLAATSERLFNGLTFDELFRMLSTTKLTIHPQSASELNSMDQIARFFGHERPAPLHLFWYASRKLLREAAISPTVEPFASVLEEADLIRSTGTSLEGRKYTLTDFGRKFLLSLRNQRDMADAESLRA